MKTTDGLAIVLAVVLGWGLGPTAAPVAGQTRGVIEDPDGFTNVRAKQRADAPVVGRVKTGEVFEFEAGEGSPWWRVTLGTGKTGWMHYSRIRWHADVADLADGGPQDELTDYGKSRGFAYHAVARAAAKGEPEAMKRFFGIRDTDGAAGEMHAMTFATVVHLLGDAKLAAFLAQQPLDYQLAVRDEFIQDMVLGPFEPLGYITRAFPGTAALLFRKEITAWKSPNGRYAVRKVFTSAEPRENSEVEAAQIVEVETGKVLADFTEQDLGVGGFREGRVLWSPDSRRVAVYTNNGEMGETMLFQMEPKGFVRVQNPVVKLPDMPGGKATKLIFRRVEPVAWKEPQVITLEWFEYFERESAGPDGMRAVSRLYEVDWLVVGGAAREVSRTVKQWSGGVVEWWSGGVVAGFLVRRSWFLV
jgi:hypothetical protein